MIKDLSRESPTFQIRRIAACNLLKAVCLGEKHDVGADQYELMYPYFSKVAGVSDIPGKDTWKKWLAGAAMFKDSKLSILDKTFREVTEHEDFIISLVQGQNYAGKRPANSPIHLHFDALDAAGYWGGGDEEDWVNKKQARAEKIFRTLHHEWDPSSGPIYSTFTSDLQLKLDTASDEERKTIRESYAKCQPDPFERFLNMPPKPDSELRHSFELASPASVWKYLFDLAKDFNFLVADRLERWALDLATASAAMYAIVYSNRYDTIGSTRPRKETLIAAGTDELFWKADTDLSIVLWRFGGLIEEVPEEILLPLYCRLWEARECYWKWMSALGISPPQIKTILDRQWEERPIAFHPTKV